MKAFNCFFMISGVMVLSDFVFGASIEIRKLVSESEKNGVVAAAPSEGAIAPNMNDLLKNAGETIAKVQQSIREINNQDNEDSLIQNLQNRTMKQLKIVGDKLVQTEEKVVSLGTKDNATIAMYKIINVRPLSFLVQTQSKKSNSDQTVEPASESSDKSLDEPNESVSWSQNDESESDKQDSIKNESSQNNQPSQQDKSSENEVAQNEQPVQQNQSAQNESGQNNEVVQQAQDSENGSAQNVPIVSVIGPDGIPKVIHGIAIKVAPKSDGTQGKNVAFQFFKK